MFDLTKVCRLCMHGVQNAPKTYNCLTDNIRDLIKKIHGFEVKNDDHLPKSLCIECHQKLQHFATHLTLVERVQDEIQKLAALELETNTVKTEPQETKQTRAEAVNATTILQQEDSDDSASTVSHISARSLERLEEPNVSNVQQNLNSSKNKNEPNSESVRRSRSEKRSLTKEKSTPSKRENGKRKRDKSKSEEAPNKPKKARPVTLKRVVNSSPNRMEYEITNSPHNTERSNRGKNSPKEPNAISTPLKAKNDQSSITKFFKKANKCESCGTSSKDPAFLKFHEIFHSTRQCPGCTKKFAGKENFDVTEHIKCFLLNTNLSKMKVSLSIVPHDQLRKVDPNCCTKKLPSNPKVKERKRKSSTQSVKSKKVKTNGKGRGKSNKSLSTADIEKTRVERKKSKSTTEAKDNMNNSMEVDEIKNISIPLNWNAETPKDKVFWIRSFGSNDPTYIQIQPKAGHTNVNLAKTIQTIGELTKKAGDTVLNLSENPPSIVPLAKVGINTQNPGSPRAIPRNRSTSFFIPAPVALDSEVDRSIRSLVNRPIKGQEQPSRVIGNPVLIPTNSGIITCIQKSVLLNSSNSSDMAQNMIASNHAGLIKARRKSVATEMTRMAMNKSYNQTNSAPPRRYSISLESQTNASNAPSQMQGNYQQNSVVAMLNQNATSLRTINIDHSYTGLNRLIPATANSPQTNQMPNNQIGRNITYLVSNITRTQSSPQQTTQLNISQGTFLPNPFPTSKPTATMVAPVITNPVPNTSQIQQPKRTQIKVLTVADLNAKVPTDNLSSLPQPIPQLNQSNPPPQIQETQSSGFSVPKPRMKLTPLRAQPPETNNVIPDTEAISVSLSKTPEDLIELTLKYRNALIDYETLNERQKTDVKQCLIRNDIWKDMLYHIKEGKPTQETLNLFKKVLPPRERQEFFASYYYGH